MSKQAKALPSLVSVRQEQQKQSAFTLWFEPAKLLQKAELAEKAHESRDTVL